MTDGDELRQNFQITKRVEYRGVVVGVVAGPSGSRELHIVDPSTATEHVVPLEEDHAREVGQALISESIKIPTAAEAAEIAVG